MYMTSDVELLLSLANREPIDLVVRAYEAKQENEKALPLFQRFAQLHPGTERARYAAQAINRIQPGTQQQPTQPQTPEQPTQQ